MPYVISTANIATATRRTLLALHERFSWRTIAAVYGVNVKYIHEMAKQGKKPTNPDVLAKMGLAKKKKPLTPFQLARLQMAEATKEILKGWKL